MIFNQMIRLEVVCHACGRELDASGESDKYAPQSYPPYRSVFVEPCQGCVDKKLEQIKRALDER